ncbi:MAG: hypothetical protein ACI4WT_09305 [Oligosphaeraceae bacterium]
MGHWTHMGAALLLAAAVSLHAEPGKGNHYGTDDNSGNHYGWGNGGTTLESDAVVSNGNGNGNGNNGNGNNGKGPGNGNHNGTDDNNGNHIGWGDGGNAGGGDEIAQGDDAPDAPAGQPVPGAVAVLALGGVAAVAIRRRHRGTAKR